jgi:D-alanyl-D-alanine carboxypeptidase
MDEEALNLSIRKFLKMVGINSQREIEHAVAKAVAEGRAGGNASFPATMTLKVGSLGVDVTYDGEIELRRR